MIVTHIRPGDLRDVWPWMRPQIEKTIRRFRLPYLPDDVYHFVQSGRAALLLFVDNGSRGFALLETLEPLSGTTLHVTLICGRLARWEQEIYVELERIARAAGARQITFVGRPGWQQRGWAAPMGTYYVRDISMKAQQ